MSQPTKATGPASDPTAPAVTSRMLIGWRNAVFAIFFIGGLSSASWVTRVPAVRDELGLSVADVGILIFGMSAGSIIGLIASTWLLARLGARSAMVLGVAVSAVGLVLVGIGSTLVPTAAIVFVGLAALGFGMGSVDVMMNVEGAAAERQIGKTLMPLMHACWSLGTVIGALLGAAASAVHLPVFWHLSIAAVVILATVIISVRFVPLRPELGDDTADTAEDRVAVKLGWQARLRQNLAVWRDMKVLLIGLIVLGMTFAEGGANDWLALASVDGHGLSNTNGAIIFGVFVTAMTVGRVFGGPVIDRYGRVLVLRACAILGIVGLLMFILAPNIWVIVIGTVLWGLGASLGFPVGMSAAADDPKNAAARVSAIAIIGYCAFLVGPPLLGLIGDSIGLLGALYVVVILMVIAGLAAPAARETTADPALR